MKKSIHFLIICILITFVTGCTSESVETQVEGAEPISVASLKGPTSIGLVKLMEENKRFESKNRYDFTIAATADEIVALIGKGQLDIAAIPANLASVLYNKSEGKISVAVINTLGVLYIVENGNALDSIEDLRGKTIYSTGKGTSPEHVLNYILKSNGIEAGKDVNIEYKSEATEVATLLASEEKIIALLPQPFIAAAQAKNQNIRVVFSMDEEWNKLEEDSSLVTGVVVVNNDFLNNNKDSFNLFLDEYNDSVDYVNKNFKESARLVGDLNIIPEAVAEKAIPLCNITFIEGYEMENRLGGYLKKIYDANPDSVGGKLPDEGFYYKR